MRVDVRHLSAHIVLLSNTAPAGAAALEWLLLDTVTIQLTATPAAGVPPSSSNASSQLTGSPTDTVQDGRQPRARRKRSRIVYDHPWQWGEYGTAGCPHPDDVELSPDECRATALMDRSPEAEALHLGNPWPVNSALIPKGCAQRLGDAVPGLVYYNENPEGGAHSWYRPVCREAGHSLYVGGCPAGFTGLTETECKTTAESFNWIWTMTFSDAASPKGCYGKAGYMYYNTHVTGTCSDPDAFNVCNVCLASAGCWASAPCGALLPPPPAAIPAASSSGAVSAKGDPHMTSITGAKFDIAQTGNHTLIHIPRHSGQLATLIDVRAFVKHEGPACLDMYMKTLHISGKWADDQQPGGFNFFAGQRSRAMGHWIPFGKLKLKVVKGTTNKGVRYLNVLAKNLNKLSMPIGGILGLDDHTEAATPEKHCRRTMTL